MMRKFKCFLRSIKARIRGIHWDGHTWTGYVSSWGKDYSYVMCLDCYKKMPGTMDDVFEREMKNV